MKTSELKGTALDWAVAECEGYNLEQTWLPAQYALEDFSPSTNWAQAGPIIEREKITLLRWRDGWQAWIWFEHTRVVHDAYGPTPLIAAMRCYVTSKLGNEVHIPEELK